MKSLKENGMAIWIVRVPGSSDETYEADGLYINADARTFDLYRGDGPSDEIVCSVGIGAGVRILRMAGFVPPGSI
jgi:hypothetical protein